MGELLSLADLPSLLIYIHRHPAMVCLCGRSLFSRLSTLLDDASDTVTFRNWQQLPANTLNVDITSHGTFLSMIESISQRHADDAVRLLGRRFAGYLGDVEVTPEDVPLANFLTTEGVLLRPDLSRNVYHMSSALIDIVIRTHVIPKRFVVHL
jgi:hypothetical protein